MKNIILFISFFYSQFSLINTLAQTNLLLNGGFEDVNVCTEYSAECGVEAWFYLQDVKAQMLSNETGFSFTGNNSFGIFFNWRGYTNYSPMIGTLLPCHLSKGKEYIFKGIISAKLNPKLLIQPGICVGPFFYVPLRKFAAEMKPDSITNLVAIPNTPFYQFEYRFKARGDERYLTFGTYIKEDTTGTKKKLIGDQSVSVVLDNFQLLPADSTETFCAAYEENREIIYAYNFRHREMDYSLFGRGELKIAFNQPNGNLLPQTKSPALAQTIKADTLRLSDVLFDFNKANLKPEAEKMLTLYFADSNSSQHIDSIQIEGHTDSIGTDVRNYQLGLERSEAAHSWLLKNKICSAAQIVVRSYGKSRPVASNQTPEGRAQNRRVEIIIFRHENKNE